MNICTSETVFFSKKIFLLKFINFLQVAHKLCLDFCIVRWSQHNGFSIKSLLMGNQISWESGRGRIKRCPARHIIAFSPTASLVQWQLSALAEDQAVITLGSSCGALRLVHTSPLTAAVQAKIYCFVPACLQSPTF